MHSSCFGKSSAAAVFTRAVADIDFLCVCFLDTVIFYFSSLKAFSRGGKNEVLVNKMAVEICIKLHLHTDATGFGDNNKNKIRKALPFKYCESFSTYSSIFTQI